uniref:ARID/BRIGHT DNA-binding domain-containing protein, putative n=1 Tax=Neospora caninum (strain Liverpool) TaxID=572307 RepID=A0A0F7UQE4_NEOCL|nr:TPA: ARID/BRIGHT DNA-binding domain-containing protein, putative [Neospora caninum Liverpool]
MDRDQFLASLEKYHLERGHPYVPGRLLGQKVDLYEMFMTAMKQGGFPRINKNNKWGYLAKHLRLVPKDKPPSAQDLEQVKRYYVKWIRHFEGERVPQHIKKDLIPPGMELPCKRSSASSSHTAGLPSGARPAGGAALGASAAAGFPQNANLFFDPQNPLAAFSSASLPSQNFLFSPLGLGPNGGLAASPYFGLAGAGVPGAASGAETPLLGLQQQGLALPGASFLGASPAYDEQLLALGAAGPRTRNERRLAQQFGSTSGAGGAAGLGPGGGVLEMNRKRSKFFLKYSPEAVAERRWKRRRREALIARGVLPPAVDVFRLQQCLEERRFAPADFIFALNILYRLSKPDRGISIQQHPGLVDQLSGILTEAALSAHRSLLRRLQPSSPDLPAFFLSIFDTDLPPASRVALLHDPIRPADLLPPLPFSSSVSNSPVSGEDGKDANLHIVSLVSAILSNILFEAGNVNFLAGVSRQCLLDASVAAGLQIAREPSEGDGASDSGRAPRNTSSFWEEVCAAARGASLLRTGGPAVGNANCMGRALGAPGGKGLPTAVAAPAAGALGTAAGGLLGSPGETTVSPDGLLVAEGGGGREAEEERRLAALREDEKRIKGEPASGEFADEDDEDEGSEAEAVELEEEILLGLSEKSDIAFTRQCRMFRRPPSFSGSGESSSLSGNGLLLGSFSSSGLGGGSVGGGAGSVSSSGALGSSLLLSLSGSGGLGGAGGDGSAPFNSKAREQERLAALVRERTLKGLASALLSALDCCALSAYEGERYLSTVCTETAMRILDAFLVREKKQKYARVCGAKGGATSPLVSPAEVGEKRRAESAEKGVEGTANVEEEMEAPQQEAKETRRGDSMETEDASCCPGTSGVSDGPCLLLSNAKRAVGALEDALAAVGDEHQQEARKEGEKGLKEESRQQVCRLLVAAAKGDVAQLLHLLVQEQASLVALEESRAASFLAALKPEEKQAPVSSAFGLLAGYGAARKATAISESGREVGLMRAEAEERDRDSRLLPVGRKAQTETEEANPRETEETGDGEHAADSGERDVEMGERSGDPEPLPRSKPEKSLEPFSFPPSSAASEGESPQTSHDPVSPLSLSAAPGRAVSSDLPGGDVEMTAASQSGPVPEQSAGAALDREGRLLASVCSPGAEMQSGHETSVGSNGRRVSTAPLVHTGRAVEQALCSGEMSETQNLLFGRPVSLLSAEASPLFSASLLRAHANGKGEDDGVSGFASSSLCGCRTPPTSHLGEEVQNARESDCEGRARLEAREQREGEAGQDAREEDGASAAAPLLLGHLGVDTLEFVFDFASFLAPGSSREAARKLMQSLARESVAASSLVAQNPAVQQFVSDLGVLPGKPDVNAASSREDRSGKGAELCKAVQAVQRVFDATPASRIKQHAFYRHVSRILQSLLSFSSSSLGQAPATWQRPHSLAAFLLSLQLLMLGEPRVLGKALEPIYSRVVAASSLLLPAEKTELASSSTRARGSSGGGDGKGPHERGAENGATSSGGEERRGEETRPEARRSGETERQEGEKAESERGEAEGGKGEDGEKRQGEKADGEPERGGALEKKSVVPKPKNADENSKSQEQEKEDEDLANTEHIRLVGWEKLKGQIDKLGPQLETGIAIVKAFTALVALLPPPPSPALFPSSTSLLYRDAPQSSWVALSFVSAVARFLRSLQEISHTRIPRVLQCAAGLHFLQAVSEFAAQMLLFRQTAIYAHLEIFLSVASAILELEVSVPSIQLPRILVKACLAVVYLAADGPAEALCEVLECLGRAHEGQPSSEMSSRQRRGRRPSPAAVEAAAKLFITPLLRFLKFRMQRDVRLQSRSELADPLAPSTALFDSEANRRLVSPACPSPFATVIPHYFVSCSKGTVSLEKSRGGWFYSQFIGAIDAVPDEALWQDKARGVHAKAAETLPEPRSPLEAGAHPPGTAAQKGEEPRLGAAALAPSEGDGREMKRRRTGEEEREKEAYRRSAQVIAECVFPFFLPEAETAREKEENPTPGRHADEETGEQATEFQGRTAEAEDHPTGKKTSDSSDGIGAVAIFLGEDGAKGPESERAKAQPPELSEGSTSIATQGATTRVGESSDPGRGLSREKEPQTPLSSLLPGEKEREDASDVEAREDDREESAGPAPLFGQDETHGAPQPSQNREEDGRGGSAPSSFYPNTSGYYPAGTPSQGDPSAGSSYPSSFYYSSDQHSASTTPGMWQQANVSMESMGASQGHSGYPGSFAAPGFGSSAPVAGRGDQQGQWMAMHPGTSPQQHYSSPYFPENYYSSSSSWRQQQWLQWQHEQQRAVARQVCGAGPAASPGGDSSFFPPAYPHMMHTQQPVQQQWGGTMYAGGWQPGSAESGETQFFGDVNGAGVSGHGSGSLQRAPGTVPSGRAGTEGEDAQVAWQPNVPHMPRDSQESAGLAGRPGEASAGGRYGAHKGERLPEPPRGMASSSHRSPHPGASNFPPEAGADGEGGVYPRDLGGSATADSTRPSHPNLHMASGQPSDRLQMPPGYPSSGASAAPGSGAGPLPASFLPRPCGAAQERGERTRETHGEAASGAKDGLGGDAYEPGYPPTQGDAVHAYLRRGETGGCRQTSVAGARSKDEERRSEREEREDEGTAAGGRPGSPCPGAEGKESSKASGRPAFAHAAAGASGGNAKKKTVKKDDAKTATDGMSAAAVAAAVAFGDEEAKVDEDVLVGVSALLLLASNSLTVPLLRPHLPTITELAWYKTTASSSLFSVVQELLSAVRDAPPVHLRGFRDGAAYFPSSCVVKEEAEKADEEAKGEEARKARISEEFAKLGSSQDLLCVRKVGQGGRLLRVPETIEMRG